MSSEEDSGDENYSPTSSRKVVPPRTEYKADTTQMDKNDLKFIMKRETLQGKRTGGIPKLLASREVSFTLAC